MAKIRMLLKNWTWQDAQNFINSFSEGNTEEGYRLAQKLIVSWDYDADLNNPDAFLDLPLNEANEILKTVYENITAFSETIETGEATVYLDRWTTRRFIEFNKAVQDKKHAKVESMLCEVVELNGKPVKPPLSFDDGAIMMKALIDSYQRSITGKN